MKKSKKIMALLLSATMAASLAACAPANPGETTKATEATEATTTAAGGQESSGESKEATGINTTDEITLTMSWWGGDTRHEATQKAIEAFEAKYPNIHIEPTFSGWQGWEEKMGLAFSNGNAEDIVQINWNWLTAFDSDGSVFQDLSQYSDVLDLSQFPESALEASKVNGEIHGVPIAMTARTMFWNKNTFDKANIEIPKTWDDLLASGEAFKTALGDEYYPLVLTEYDRMIFMVYYLESVYGKDWVVDGKLNYSKEEIAEGFAMLRELEEKHVMPTVQMIKDYAADPIEKSDRWTSGYWAGIYTWNTSPNPVKMALPEDQQANFVTGPMFEGFEHKGGFSKISMEFAITKTSKHPVEAAAFINFMLNEEEGVLAMSGERGVPASAAGFKIAQDNDIVDPLIAEATEVALANAGFNLDPYFEDADLKTPSEGVYYKVTSAHSYGNINDEEAAQELMDGINAVLNRQ